MLVASKGNLSVPLRTSSKKRERLLPGTCGAVLTLSGAIASRETAVQATASNAKEARRFIVDSGLGSERAGVAPAVDHQVLSGNVTGVDRAEKGAKRAKLLRIAVALSGVGGGALAPELIEALSGRFQHA